MKKVGSLIKEMKDFGYLFKLFKIDQESPRKEVIIALQNRFIEILPSYNNKECPNFINEVAELIYQSDKNNVHISYPRSISRNNINN